MHRHGREGEQKEGKQGKVVQRRRRIECRAGSCWLQRRRFGLLQALLGPRAGEWSEWIDPSVPGRRAVKRWLGVLGLLVDPGRVSP